MGYKYYVISIIVTIAVVIISAICILLAGWWTAAGIAITALIALIAADIRKRR